MKFCDYYYCFAKLQQCVHKVLIETVTNTRMHLPHGCTHMYVLCENINKLNILTSCFTLLYLSQNTTIHFSISILPRDEIGYEVVNALKLILGIRSANKL